MTDSSLTDPSGAAPQATPAHGGPIDRLRRLALAMMPLAAWCRPSLAAFPERPVRIVVPFPPGGGTDTITRTLAEALKSELGQPVVVENKPGASTVIGTEFVARSAPDGYTMVMSTFSHAVNPSLMARLPYGPNALAAVALIGRTPNLLVVNAERPYRTVQDLLAQARANPGKLTYGSFGNGSSAHLAGELLKIHAKVDLTHVPYKGSAPALTDLIGGQIDLMVTTPASVVPHIRSGKLRALAVTSATRFAPFPDLPTLADAGMPGYQAEAWYGLFTAAGTPPEVIARVNAAVRQAMRGDAFRKRIDDEGLVPASGPPDELERYVRAEEIRWARVVQDARIKETP